MPPDPAPIRGRWTIVRCHGCGAEALLHDGQTFQAPCYCALREKVPFDVVSLVAVPDEAAIERGERARDKALEIGYGQSSAFRIGLRAALEPPA